LVTKIVINFCKIAIIYIQRYLLVPLLAEVGVQFCKIAILHITANDGPIHPQPFAYIALRVCVVCYPYPAYDRAVWGIVARRCASEKGVQPQNLYFGRAVSGSGARAAMLLVAASACARNASSTCQSRSLISKVHHRRLHFGHLRRRRIYSPWAVAIWVV